METEIDHAIMEARCIVREHQVTLWEREHPEIIEQARAIESARTPMQRLEWIEAFEEIQWMIEECRKKHGD